jgi:UDP:flavonoid glycosyltransferase YjiC (YdhE family)
MRKKILFIPEAVAWSHVFWLLVLARGLDPRKYEVHFASAKVDERMFHGTDFTRWPISSASFEKTGPAYSFKQRRMYAKAVIAKHVAEELSLYEAIRPDVVVSAVRWSTAVSAPVFGVPCASVITPYYTYWTRRSTGRYWFLPAIDYPMFRLLPTSIANVLVSWVLRYIAAPVNELRREHGLPALGDLIDVMTWGDRVLFPDDPLLVSLTYQAPHETFLGPLLWSLQIPLPEYWDELGRDRPMVYASMGSSGAARAVPSVLEGLGGMDVDVVFSTAGYAVPKHLPPNVHVVDMIPGDLAARKAAVVVCNGGAGTGYQALAEGTPVVSIPLNPDQYFAAIATRNAGAGLILRASTVTAARVRAAVECVMREEGFTQAAQRVAESFASFDPHARFRAVIDEVIAHNATANGMIRSETLKEKSLPNSI